MYHAEKSDKTILNLIQFLLKSLMFVSSLNQQNYKQQPHIDQFRSDKEYYKLDDIDLVVNSKRVDSV